MASDKIEIRIPAFHKKVENLVEKELNKTTQKRALSVWILIILILASVILFGYFNVASGNGSEKALMEYRYDPVRFLWKDISMLGILFLYILGATVMLWFIAKTLFKIKADFQLVLYAGGLGFLFLMTAFLLIILFRLIGNIPYLDIVGSILELLVWLSIPYVGFVVIKTVFKTTYGKSILLYIADINVVSIVFFLVIFVLWGMLISQPIRLAADLSYGDKIIHNNDGSITLISEYSLANGRYYDSCQITFPKGWVVVENHNIGLMDPENAVFGNYETGEKAYVIHKNIKFGDYDNCKLWKGEDINPVEDRLYIISEDIHFYIPEKYASVCAFRGVSNQRVMYRITYRIIPAIGYEIEYYVPENQKDNFEYIVNNSKCEYRTDGSIWTELFYT